MKKILFIAILACMFASCSSDGSREIQIDEISFTSGSDYIKANEVEKVSSIFEVVPGKYELSWKLVQEAPQLQNYNVSLKLKLRLKRTVKFSEEFLKKISNADSWFHGFEFDLLDADGKEDHDVQTTYIGWNGCVTASNESEWYDKDEIMDFINFLQSKPGTEKEFELNFCGSITSVDGVDCIETCKNAKSVICKVVISDKEFESRIGVIE